MIVYEPESDRVQRAEDNLRTARIVERAVGAIERKQPLVAVVHEFEDSAVPRDCYAVYIANGDAPPLYFGMLAHIDNLSDVRVDLAKWFAQYEVFFEPATTLQIDVVFAPRLHDS